MSYSCWGAPQPATSWDTAYLLIHRKSVDNIYDIHNNDYYNDNDGDKDDNDKGDDGDDDDSGNNGNNDENYKDKNNYDDDDNDSKK